MRVLNFDSVDLGKNKSDKRYRKRAKKGKFNDLEGVTPSRVVGRSREWSIKLKINSSIWQLKWHYGVGKRRDIRYGYAS